MFILFTDFGLEGPYTGQMKAKLIESVPQTPIIDLFSDAPSQNPRASAYLLAAYAENFPKESVFLCVVDPGVGGDLPGVVVRAKGQWFVGPGNGLFEMILRRADSDAKIWEIDWRAESVAPSFHGRDIFAPVAAMLALGQDVPGSKRQIDWQRQVSWPDDLSEIVYIDQYGNAFTGLGHHCVKPSFALMANNVYLQHSEVFSGVSKGQAFWYVNSNGLVEIAVNQGDASRLLKLEVGTKILVSDEAHR